MIILSTKENFGVVSEFSQQSICHRTRDDDDRCTRSEELAWSITTTTATTTQLLQSNVYISVMLHVVISNFISTIRQHIILQSSLNVSFLLLGLVLLVHSALVSTAPNLSSFSSSSHQFELMSDSSYRNFILRQYFIDLLNISHSSLVRSMVFDHHEITRTVSSTKANVWWSFEQSFSFSSQVNSVEENGRQMTLLAPVQCSPCHQLIAQWLLIKFDQPFGGLIQSNRSLRLNLSITWIRWSRNRWSNLCVSPFETSKATWNCSPSISSCTSTSIEISTSWISESISLRPPTNVSSSNRSSPVKRVKHRRRIWLFPLWPRPPNPIRRKNWIPPFPSIYNSWSNDEQKQQHLRQRPPPRANGKPSKSNLKNLGLPI